MAENRLDQTVETASAQKRLALWLRCLGKGLYIFLLTVAAVMVISSLWVRSLRICGGSMEPALREGEVVLAVRRAEIRPGDLVAFRVDDLVLIKRCVAGPGQWVDIDQEGNVYIDGEKLDEPYLSEKSRNFCSIGLPCLVPENCYFCLGDHRSTSADSRNIDIGCIPDENIIGKVVVRLWPLSELGTLESFGEVGDELCCTIFRMKWIPY